MKISYNPAIFRVLEVTGSLEYFQCNIPGSQQLYRAKGKLIENTCEFFLTTKYSANTPSLTTGGGEVSLKVYRHNETFESNYKVDLEKKETMKLEIHYRVLHGRYWSISTIAS